MSGASTSPRLSYSSSIRSIQYGAQPAPASRKARRRSGKRSGIPSKTIDVSWRIWPKGCEQVCAWMKRGERSTPAPPRCEPEAWMASIQSRRREEHRLLHASLVERPEPGVRGPGGIVVFREEPTIPAVRRNDRKDELPVAERGVHVLHHLLGGLGHVAVGVDDCHGRDLLTASRRSR